MTVLRWIGVLATMVGVLFVAQWLTSGTPGPAGPIKPYVWHAPTGLPASPAVPQPRGPQLDPCPGGYTLWNSCYGGRKDR